MIAPKWWLDLGVERRDSGRLWHRRAAAPRAHTAARGASWGADLRVAPSVDTGTPVSIRIRLTYLLTCLLLPEQRMWRAGGREGIGLRRLGCVCGRRLVTASCVPRETILKGPPRPGPRVPVSISPSLYLSTSLAAAPPNPNPNPNPDPDPDPNPNPNQSPLECEGQPRPKASRPGRPLGVSRAVAVGPPRRRRHFHDMRP